MIIAQESSGLVENGFYEFLNVYSGYFSWNFTPDFWYSLLIWNFLRNVDNKKLLKSAILTDLGRLWDSVHISLAVCVAWNQKKTNNLRIILRPFSDTDDS